RRNRQLATLRLAHIARSKLLHCNSRAPAELEAPPRPQNQEDRVTLRDPEDRVTPRDPEDREDLEDRLHLVPQRVRAGQRRPSEVHRTPLRRTLTQSESVAEQAASPLSLELQESPSAL